MRECLQKVKKIIVKMYIILKNNKIMLLLLKMIKGINKE